MIFSSTRHALGPATLMEARASVRLTRLKSHPSYRVWKRNHSMVAPARLELVVT